MSMKIGIVGLGLIGGSFAKALKGYMNCKIIAFDKSQYVLDKAIKQGVVDVACKNDYMALSLCDIVIVALPPQLVCEFILEHKADFKSGCILTDVCGIKDFSINLKNDVEYIGGHPMAGKAEGGYDFSDAEIFIGANYILTVNDKTTEKAILQIAELARYIGCEKVTLTDSKTHDKIIGFTSQMPHVLALSIVNSENFLPSKGFEGNSLRDFIRIANIEEEMWTQLFLCNQENLVNSLEEFIKNVTIYKDLIKTGDKQGLQNRLKAGRLIKEQYDHERNND